MERVASIEDSGTDRDGRLLCLFVLNGVSAFSV